MVDIQLRELALTKAGYEVVYNEAMNGWHLRLPDGEYHTEHVSGLPDWFASEELAWRAAPAVEVDLNATYEIILDRHADLTALYICRDYVAGKELEAV